MKSSLGNLADEILAINRVALLNQQARHFSAVGSRDNHFLKKKTSLKRDYIYRKLERAYHLHSAKNSDWVTLLDFRALVDSNLDNNTAHRSADLAAVTNIGLGAGNILNGSLLVVDSDLTDFSVHLVEDLTLTGLFRKRTNGEQLENKDLTLLKLNVELLANLRPGQKVAGRKNRKVTELLNELLVVLEDLGVHGVAGHIVFSGASKLLPDVVLDLDEVQGLQEKTRTLVKLAALAKCLGAQRLGETAVGLAHKTFQELKDGTREIQLCCTVDNVLRCQFVGDNELGKITNDLGSRRDLDDIAEEIVGNFISLLGLGPLLA